jgi:acyl carrier protein
MEENDVIELVKLYLGRETVRREDRIVEDLGAESADIVNVIAAVEDRFSFEIGEEELVSIRTVGDLIDRVNSRNIPQGGPGAATEDRQ